MDKAIVFGFGALVAWLLTYFYYNGVAGNLLLKVKGLFKKEPVKTPEPVRELVPVRTSTGNSDNGVLTYWVSKAGDQGPFVALHMPYGGVYQDNKIPVDGYVVLSGSTGMPTTVMDGTLFRTLFTVAKVAQQFPTKFGRARQPRTLVTDNDTPNDQELLDEYDLKEEQNIGPGPQPQGR